MAKPGKAAKWAARKQRLSEALRQNLKRRKAQARGRNSQGPASPGETGADDDESTPKLPDFRRNPGRD